jgi:ketosteroid isomerase-like protein
MHKIRVWALFAIVALTATSGQLSAQIGRGGDQPARNAVANAYRSEVRNRLNSLVIQLAGAWDASEPKQPTAFYSDRAVIVLGPVRTIEGRDAIRSAFGSTLRHMRGVVLTIDDYDLSGELAVVRGTMIYELLHDQLPGTQETATYTMVLQLRCRSSSSRWRETAVLDHFSTIRYRSPAQWLTSRRNGSSISRLRSRDA